MKRRRVVMDVLPTHATGALISGFAMVGEPCSIDKSFQGPDLDFAAEETQHLAKFFSCAAMFAAGLRCKYSRGKADELTVGSTRVIACTGCRLAFVLACTENPA
jgi:hypothetical protein